LGDIEDDIDISMYASKDDEGKDETVFIGRRRGCTKDIWDDEIKGV
jgi:hypothetical protein